MEARLQTLWARFADYEIYMHITMRRGRCYGFQVYL